MISGSITKNTAARNGGSIYSSRGSLIVTNVTIDENSADASGGGYYVDGGSVAFTTCSFSGNTKGATGIGAGGASRGTSVTFPGGRMGTQPGADFVTF